MAPRIPGRCRPPQRDNAARGTSLTGRWIFGINDAVWSTLRKFLRTGAAQTLADEIEAMRVVNEAVEDGVGIGADLESPRSAAREEAVCASSLCQTPPAGFDGRCRLCGWPSRSVSRALKLPHAVDRGVGWVSKVASPNCSSAGRGCCGAGSATRPRRALRPACDPDCCRAPADRSLQAIAGVLRRGAGSAVRH